MAIPESLTRIATEALIALLMAVAGYALSLFVHRALQSLLSRHLDPGWSRFVANLARYLVLGATLYFVVQRTGTSGLIVIVITALTGAFAIGSERTASDMVSGIKLFFMRQYKVGDLVTVAGQRGRVTEITLTYTALQNDALDKTIIPNSEAVNKIIINHSQIPGFPVSVIVPVNADQCVEKVTTLLQACAQNFEPRLMRPDFQPIVSVADIAAGKVNYLVKVIVSEEARSSDNSDIAGLLRLAAMRALASGGIPVG